MSSSSQQAIKTDSLPKISFPPCHKAEQSVNNVLNLLRDRIPINRHSEKNVSASKIAGDIALKSSSKEQAYPILKQVSQTLKPPTVFSAASKRVTT